MQFAELLGRVAVGLRVQETQAGVKVDHHCALGHRRLILWRGDDHGGRGRGLGLLGLLIQDGGLGLRLCIL